MNHHKFLGLLIFIVGIAGSGKSTLLRLLKDAYPELVQHIEMSEALSDEEYRQRNPADVKDINRCQSRGRLAPDDCALRALRFALGKQGVTKGFESYKSLTIVTGFPRTKGQARFLHQLRADLPPGLLLRAVELELSQEEAFARITNRKERPVDNDLKLAEERIWAEACALVPVREELEELKRKGVLVNFHTFDAASEPDEVFRTFLTELKRMGVSLDHYSATRPALATLRPSLSVG